MKSGKPKAHKAPRATKKPAKTKRPPTPAAGESPLGDADARRRQLRVANLRDKIRHALDDPDKRQQLVEAIRVMMRGES
jgi:hypothetical protein